MDNDLTDIRNKADIKIFVDAFYEKAKSDSKIGPVFLARINIEEWQIHMDRMYGFWNTVLFSEKDYMGNPFSKHIGLPIESIHFDTWLNLLNETLEENFAGPKAEEVRDRAHKMSLMFQAKLNQLRSGGKKYPIM